MLWMSGNSIQIFSILITFMLFFNGMKAILSTNQTFEKFGIQSNDKDGFFSLFDVKANPLLLPKVVFILVQSIHFGLGIWKCASMGLLPTAQSDWLAFMEPKTALESFLNL